MAAATAAISLAVAACGDDNKDKGSEKASSGLSRPELVKRADPICKRHFQKISAAASKVLAGGRLPDQRKFGRLAQGTIIPETTAQIRELRALKPADDVAPDYRMWLSTSDAALKKIKGNPALVRNPATFKDANGQADKLGLSKQCHVGPDVGPG